MTHLTRSEIEHRLLSGAPVTWSDANGKDLSLILDDPKGRRLFAFLLQSTVREPTGLPDEFVQGLYDAFSAADDPASGILGDEQEATNGPWRLQSIKTKGFGGLNVWGGPDFELTLDSESILIEGPNGSGKSSLVGAITWALSGERPRDQADGNAHDPKPVFGDDDQAAGNWPPIACYPKVASDFATEPTVYSCLFFRNENGDIAKVERVLDEGQVTAQIDPIFHVPPILIETGVLMPARLATIRLDDGRGRLTDAVQKLTGMDELVAIGSLVMGLCHKSREYLAYERKELAAQLKIFNDALTDARNNLDLVDVIVPEFEPADTDDKNSEFAKLGKHLNDRAAELTKVISQDLADGLDLSSPTVQHDVIAAIGAARTDLQSGLSSVDVWRSIKSIAGALNTSARQTLLDSIETAKTEGKNALALFEKSKEDSRFQLKAVASQWHDKHKSGPIDNCPLCENLLMADSELSKDLETLRSAGEAAASTLQDNANRILSDLSDCVPESLKRFNASDLDWDPKVKLSKEIESAFATHDRYAKTLTKFASISSAALTSVPGNGLSEFTKPDADGQLAKVKFKIAVIQRLIELADWYGKNESSWSDWWKVLADGNLVAEEPKINEGDDETDIGNSVESLSGHLDRLSNALSKAEPYRLAAANLRKSWTAGLLAAAIQKELKRRMAVSDQLIPLKNLGSFAEAIARETIDRLSDRISVHLKNTLITDQLQFQSTNLDRKKGLVVRGGFVDEFRIDATLVANTSWLRAVLWAFLFSLREEAIEQEGGDPFPILVFDDPQATFDLAHRHRWAQYVSSLQHGDTKAQILLTTYDEVFLDLVKVSGIAGRQALIAAPCEQLPCAGIFEGELLDRCWTETVAANSNAAGATYIAKVRVYVEGLLRLMLRGEDSQALSVVGGFVVGDSRNKLSHLHDKGLAPWDRSEFENLINALDKNATSIKHMEISHHTGGSQLGMAEAQDVEEYWRKKLKPKLQRAFRLAGQHYLMHGGLNALHVQPPTANLPEGFKSKVKEIPLTVSGRASALSNGHVADGLLDVNDFGTTNCKKVVLAQHLAYRLTAPTLEPVACPGDILIVKEVGKPTPKSLVVALSDERILARRLEVAANHSDVAVLTAQSINPRQIAPPEIAHKATFKLFKIVGVIYDQGTWTAPITSGIEVAQCEGENVLHQLAADAFGLIEVEGQSAEPYALHGQCLIVRNKTASTDDIKSLVGKPVIAADSDDNRYFKRLQITDDHHVVLESLDSAGVYGPIVLSQPGGDNNALTGIWPVAGVLFELPS